MLDQLRRDIQTRLDQVLSEAEKLRHAMLALTSHDGADPNKPNGSSGRTRSRRRARAAAKSAPSSRGPAPGRTGSESVSRAAATPPDRAASQTAAPSNDASTRTRTASGATKTAVLKTLASGTAMTAGEVANATGLGRASVSTTLSKLAKSGEVTKADRGYRIAG